MHYFKNKQDILVSIEDKLWDAVKKNEPWLKETDKHGNELNAPLTLIKEVKPIPEIKPVLEIKPVIAEKPFETLKVEKLKPVKNVTTTRTKRKAKATKTR